MKNRRWLVPFAVGAASYALLEHGVRTLRRILSRSEGECARWAATPRRTLATSRPGRDFPSIHLQYVILPYLNLRVDGVRRGLEVFSLGPYQVWKDTEENWQTVLGITRPAQHLGTYVGRDGESLQDMWIATASAGAAMDSERWQHLVAALYYLAWCRVPFHDWARPRADDFYFEVFGLPAGSQQDSPSHVRYSKYDATLWSALKVYPSPDVSKESAVIIVPGKKPAPNLRFEEAAIELFHALDRELIKEDSNVLTALWFFLQARFRSASRSSYAEDIQNMCTAFEALLDVWKRGDSARQVADGLSELFRKLMPSAADEFCGRAHAQEDSDVLCQLRQWVAAFYMVRNAYTHGKTVKGYLFFGRSIWQDAFEIFRLSANRVILGHPESRPFHGSQVSKLLMSGIYVDELVAAFKDKRQALAALENSPRFRIHMKGVLDRAKGIDPERVGAVHSLPQIKKALFTLGSLVYQATKQASSINPDDHQLGDTVNRMEQAHTSASSSGRLSVGEYLILVAPVIRDGHRLIPVFGNDLFLLDFSKAFQILWDVYRGFQKID